MNQKKKITIIIVVLIILGISLSSFELIKYNNSKTQKLNNESRYSKEKEKKKDEKKQEESNNNTQIENTKDYSNNESNNNSLLEIKRNGKVVVYLFRGEGCPHCTEAEKWFDSMKDEYGDLFTVVDYEVWYNEENAELMEKVAKSRGEEATGVPYIIIGNKSWNGFTEGYGQEMINEIESVSSEK